ncbi:hypothetical protein [Saccharothrix australiensis]|uniref:Uncharacterized protein n=1 Tax=Saccharothrix australiensis TaxID=2072 RepID=A0A495VUK4_9PSEU|nr:hypothetical protein [Saccharothrix australiensis]RKT53066.1 hypothetical protein C8E97_1614 [Saccharothrix australiensis]
MTADVRLVFAPDMGSRVEVVKWPGTRLHALRLVLGAGQAVVLAPSDRADGSVELATYLTKVAIQAATVADLLDPAAEARMEQGQSLIAIAEELHAQGLGDVLREHLGETETDTGRYPL